MSSSSISYPIAVPGLALLVLTIASLPAAAAVIPLEVADIALLEIGDDLAVSWSQAPPNTPLVVRLVDESGASVVEVEGSSDENGALGDIALWRRSGIVGCDPESDPQAEEYRFRDFDEAETVLVERVFGIEVREAAFGILLLYKDLEFQPGQAECVHFSDETGCPRQVFRLSEKIYLTGRHLSAGPNQIRFFLVEAGEVPAVGDPLEEVRADYEGSGQRFALANAGVDFIERVGEAQGDPGRGCYLGVVRRGNEPDSVRLEEDVWADIDLCGFTFNKANAVNTVVRTSDKPDDGPDCPETSP
jgi:hypothetical protein